MANSMYRKIAVDLRRQIEDGERCPPARSCRARGNSEISTGRKGRWLPGTPSGTRSSS
jgi:hypothetical protein